MIRIDQSNKIERPGKSTFLALANDTRRVIELPASVKRNVLVIIKKKKPNVDSVFYLFGLAVFLLIETILKEKNAALDYFMVDNEYTGHEQLIKSILLRLSEKASYKLNRDQITFALIGRNCRAHELAYGAFRGDVQVDQVVTEEQLIALM